MAEKFAKLYERDGQQVLVTKDQDDAGDPILRVRFKTNNEGHDVSTAIAFKKDSELDKWAILDRAFDVMDEERAFDIRDGSPGVNL